MEGEVLTNEHRRKVGVVEANVWDNSIDKGVRGRLDEKDINNMIAEYDEDDKQARIYGKFQHLTGIVFKKFNRRVHVIKPFQVNERDFVVVEALDPHPRNEDALLWVAVDRQGTYFVVDEVYEHMKTSAIAAYSKKRDDKFRIELRISDPSGFNEDQHDELRRGSLANRLYNDHDLTYIKGTKDRRGADRRIKDAIHYEEKGNEIILPPELYIFSTCERLIYEMEHYQWDDWRGRAAERKSPLERPMDKDDHCIECLGRILLTEPKFFPMVLPSPNNRNAEMKNDDFDVFD